MEHAGPAIAQQLPSSLQHQRVMRTQSSPAGTLFKAAPLFESMVKSGLHEILSENSESPSPEHSIHLSDQSELAKEQDFEEVFETSVGQSERGSRNGSHSAQVTADSVEHLPERSSVSVASRCSAFEQIPSDRSSRSASSVCGSGTPKTQANEENTPQANEESRSLSSTSLKRNDKNVNVGSANTDVGGDSGQTTVKLADYIKKNGKDNENTDSKKTSVKPGRPTAV